MAVFCQLSWLISHQVALDDVSATEWRKQEYPSTVEEAFEVALDDVSATEWRRSKLLCRVHRT